MTNNLKKIIYLSFIVFLGFVLSVKVLALAEDEIKNTISTYRNYKEVLLPKILVPTVVEIPFIETSLERFDFLVLNKTTNNFEPSLLLIKKDASPLNVTIRDLNSNSQIFNGGNILDDNESSYIELPIVGDITGSAEITVTSQNSLTTDSLFLLLDNYVALPNMVSVSAGIDQNLKTVLATKKVDSQSIYFPQTSATKFVIKLTYSQPLRITELRLGGYNVQSKSYKLRFLAQPNNQYKVYFDPDRRINTKVGEMGNLTDNNDVLMLGGGVSVVNPSYLIADSDGDNVPDVLDNCVSISNSDQEDINKNGRGDVCDDFDKDGLVNSLDNCPDLPNYNQQDTDGDKIGDVCDGVESRLTEKYPWLPWLGIGLASLIVIGLFVFTALPMRKKPDLPPSN